MKRPEYSNNRDLSYSEWHRDHLPSECYVMNLDWIEYRKNNEDSRNPKIVCLIEDKDDRAGELQIWKRSVMIQIANALNVSAYIVYHNVCRRYDHHSLWKFKVTNLITNETQMMDETQYRNFIEKL